MTRPYRIEKNNYGFFECKPKPDKETLNEFYSKKYFQENNIYAKEYESTEIEYIKNIFARKLELLKSSKDFLLNHDIKALEVGVGEGWTLSGLIGLNIQATGIDYSSYACSNHNKHVLHALETGEPETIIQKHINENRKYDLIWLDNVLEHSPTPEAFIKSLSSLANPNCHLIIEVPNDYSLIQNFSIDNDLIKDKFWEAIPEHLSYFNIIGLNNLCSAFKWQPIRAISDFPIDLFLLNDDSNYISDKSKGKNVHKARVRFEAMLETKATSSTLNFYESMLSMGIGRQITALYRMA